MRFELPLFPAPGPQQRPVPAGADQTMTLRLIGQVTFPAPLGATVDVWWLRQYGGGLFLPLRDGTAGDASYGAGRYALDTAKGADLGGTASTLIIDLNFLYHTHPAGITTDGSARSPRPETPPSHRCEPASGSATPGQVPGQRKTGPPRPAPGRSVT
jgi:uncharacterized protein (DUF1684 family)